MPYRYYVLIVLMITYAVSVTDRMAMSILMEAIKADFTLSDTQMGLLAGLAFTFFNALLGIPVARLADRSNRRNILAGAVGIWSAMTALCGAASGFWTLFMARLGVGFGEAGGTSPAISMISDYFERDKLARAMGIYSVGATLGMVAGLIGGGFLAASYGWRMTFVLLGIPGIALALLVYFTVREPLRSADHAADKSSFSLTLKSLAANPVYARTALANGIAIIIAYAFAVWMAPIMMRNFAVGVGEVGLYLGIAFLVGGVPGMLAGGYVTDALTRRDERWRSWLPALVLVLALPFYLLCLNAVTLASMLAYFIIASFFFNATQGPAISTMQLSVKPSERALASSFAGLIASILGYAIGPALTGMISDALAPEYGAQSLNYAIMILCAVLIPAAFAYIWAGAAMRHSSQVMEAIS
jgi:predicted MFS family arabinose efflux permease